MCALRLRARAVPLYFSSFAAAVVSMQITITKTIENAAKYFLQLLPYFGATGPFERLLSLRWRGKTYFINVFPDLMFNQQPK